MEDKGTGPEPAKTPPGAATPTEALGSRSRGPDERAPVADVRAVPGRPAPAPLARQAALAVERQAVRVRRFRLRSHDAARGGPAGAAPAAAPPTPPTSPTTPLLGAIAGSLLATIAKRALRGMSERAGDSRSAS